MTAILVVNADTVVGGNLAIRWAADHRVGTIGARIDGAVACPSTTNATELTDALGSPLDWIVLCDPECDVVRWSRLANELGCDLTLISSDAVLAGPRLFHDETSECFATSSAARAILAAESTVLRALPTSLVVRTNAYGWTPGGHGPIESLLETLEAGRPWTANVHEHTTPIHAAQLADLLIAARERGHKGLWHAGGGERIGPAEFATRLAAAFEIDDVATIRGERGAPHECSLRSNRLAAALDVALPMIDDGLDLLVEECEDQTRDRLHTSDVGKPATIAA